MTPEVTERLIQKGRRGPCEMKVSAVAFDRKGNAFAYAHNRSKYRRRGGGVHAEMHLMLKYGKAIRSIIICRVTKTGIIHRMDPCEACAKKAEKLGIKITSLKE